MRSSSRTRLPRLAVVRALFPLVPPDALLALPPAIGTSIVRLSSLRLLLLVDLNKPLRVAVLVLALVTPLGYPLARGLVVNKLAVALLVLDTLLGGKALPLGRFLGGGDGLFAGNGGGRRGEHKVHALGARLDFAGGQQLVDEGLSGIARGGGEDGLVGGGGDWVGVVGEQVAEIEGEWGGLVDGYGPAGCALGGGRFVANKERVVRTGGWSLWSLRQMLRHSCSAT